MQNNMKRIIFILLLCVVATGVVSSIVYSAPPANVGYVGTLLPVNGDDKNDIGTSTNEFRNLYLSRGLITTSANNNSIFAGNVGIRLTNPASTLAISEKHGSGIPTLGSELTDATNWTSPDWTGDYNVGFTHTAGNTTNLSRTMTVANTSYYQIAFTISGRTAGSVTVALGYATTTQTFSANQAHGVGHKPVTTNGPLVFIPTTDFDGKISAISVKIISAVSNPIFVLHDSAGTAGVEFRQGTSSLQNTFMGSGAGSYNTTGSFNVAQGFQSLYSNTTGTYNTAQGNSSLRQNTTGQFNTAQGANSLYSNTTGSYNSAQGYGSLYSNTTGSYNSAQGQSSLPYNTTGSYNSAQGQSSLYQNTTGSYNSAQGMYSLYSNTTGSNNTAQGYGSLNFNTTGNYNTAQGYQSLRLNTTGQQNSGNGYQALYSNTTGSYNTALGVNAVRSSVSGQYNTGIGFESLYYNTSATNTTAIGANAGRGTANYNAQGGVYLGYQAGYSAGTGGDYNTMLGYQAGYNVTTGSDNIIIGQNVNATSSTSGAGLNIGNVLYGVGMYSGSTVSATPTADGRIGIGTSSPRTDLQVNEATATSTISATVVNGSTRSTTMGGKLILQDMAGGTCTEITTQSGVMSARAVACP